MKTISAGWRPESGAGRGEGGGDELKSISIGWRLQSGAGGERNGMKAISAG